MWAARLTRGDTLWAVNKLARSISKWDVACDKRLYRLICYLHSTREKTLYSFVGDDPEACRLVHYIDASFAEDIVDSKSTTGGLLFLMGPQTCGPLGHFT